MYDKLQKIIEAYEDLEAKLGDPAVLADQKEYTRLAKEHARQGELVAAARKYISLSDQLKSAKDELKTESDPELKELAQEEISELEAQLPPLEEDIKFMLLPADPNDEKDIIVEIRGGAGGDEANIFAGDLFKMYERFAESKKWKVEVIDASASDMGGYKEISFKVLGDKVYSSMKFESGVHRVQRVPKTESQGRIHTSTATVAVLPEASEQDLVINPDDLRIDIEDIAVQICIFILAYRKLLWCVSLVLDFDFPNSCLPIADTDNRPVIEPKPHIPVETVNLIFRVTAAFDIHKVITVAENPDDEIISLVHFCSFRCAHATQLSLSDCLLHPAFLSHSGAIIQADPASAAFQ